MTTPDSWVVLKISDGLYKVLAGWSGGYLHGSSWQLNSGIKRAEKVDGHFRFHGYSGSIYQCSPKAYGLRMSTMGAYEYLKDKVELLPENTDWLSLPYGE